MRAHEKGQVASTANGILYLWKKLIEEAARNEPDAHRRCWYKRDAMQAYQDAVICMKTNGLIEDYDVEKVQVKMNGGWIGNIRGIVV